jgi:hypothetical protein
MQRGHLVIFQEVNGVRDIARVEHMYKQFPRGLFKHDDDVARLDYLLHYEYRAQ